MKLRKNLYVIWALFWSIILLPAYFLIIFGQLIVNGPTSAKKWAREQGIIK